VRCRAFLAFGILLSVFQDLIRSFGVALILPLISFFSAVFRNKFGESLVALQQLLNIAV
jgi:hypothetical protein